MTPRLPPLLALLLAATLAIPALAAPATPVNVTADKFEINELSHKAVFTGNVVVTRTSLKLWAPTLIVLYGAGGTSDIESFTASGGVRIKTPDQDATGSKAVFDPTTQILKLTGNVKVVNSAGTLNGPELIIDLANNTSAFNGTKSGRVTGVFTPQ